MTEITEEKREQMNQLYFVAIEFRRAQLKFCDHVSQKRLKDFLDAGDNMHRILVRINSGKDPVCFVSGVENVTATASMLLST